MHLTPPFVVPGRRFGAALLLAAAALAPPASAQGWLFPVTTNDPAALAAAIQLANARAFQASASNPVVIEFGSGLVGQTIVLAQNLPLLVVDHVTLRVANAGPLDRVTIDARGGQTLATTTLRLTSRHATVQNLAFENAGAPGSQEDVFTAFGTEHLTLVDCDFDGATGNGLWLIGARHTLVQGCRFQGSSAGLVATGGPANLDVVNCSFTNNGRGLQVNAGSDVVVRGSTFDGNANAMQFLPVCANVTVGPGNVVRNTTTFAAIVASGTVGLLVTGNQCHDNSLPAIVLQDFTYNAAVRGNTLLRNGQPGQFQLVVTDSQNVLVDGLQCTDGGAGIYGSRVGNLTIAGSAAAPTTIARNRAEAVTVLQCTGVLLQQITVDDNLRSATGGQITVLDSSHVDVVASTVTGAVGVSRSGCRIQGSTSVRIGNGSSVLDHGGSGILVGNCSDVVLGNWPPGAGSLSVRGPNALQIVDSNAVRVAGTPAAPCTVVSGTVGNPFVVFVSGGSGGVFGPDLVVDGQQAADTALQIANSGGAVVEAVVLRGHTNLGLVAAQAPALSLRGCDVLGGSPGQFASGQGVLLNPGCDGARLLGNRVQRHQGDAFFVLGSDHVWFGPGNRAIDNRGDGFVVVDPGSGPPTRRVTIQSTVAVGSGLSGQSGYRLANMLGNLTNVTATRHGTGVLLQVGSDVTLVNAISWGNGLDRNRDNTSIGRWYSGMRATSGGTTSPGGWTEQGMLNGVDPQFVAAASGDVSLRAGSPAIDSGLHATPAGAGLPCVDAALQPRIRGGVVDRGAHEFGVTATPPNTLDLAGPWLRAAAQNDLALTVQLGAAQAGDVFVLLLSGSGTGPGYLAPTGRLVPLLPDVFTGLLLSAPALCLGALDVAGRGTLTLSVPPQAVPFLPELTFVAAFVVHPTPTNPVVTRFLP